MSKAALQRRFPMWLMIIAKLITKMTVHMSEDLGLLIPWEGQGRHLLVHMLENSSHGEGGLSFLEVGHLVTRIRFFTINRSDPFLKSESSAVFDAGHCVVPRHTIVHRSVVKHIQSETVTGDNQKNSEYQETEGVRNAECETMQL